MKNILDSGNVADDIIKSFNHIIDKNLEPTELDLALFEAHKKIISDALENCDNNLNAEEFLCGYKKMLKEFKRSKDIAAKARQFLSQNAKPNDVDEYWLNVFFDKAKLITSESMQILWGKILAEEVNAPGAIPLSLLHTISMMGHNQASSFCNLARFCFREFHTETYHPLIFIQTNSRAYAKSEITFPVLKELEHLGLIYCNFTNEFCFYNKKTFISGNRMLEIWGDPSNENKILAGNVILTDNGKLLFNLVGNEYKKYREDIFNFTVHNLHKRNCTVYVNSKKL